MQEKQNPKTPGDSTGLLHPVLLGSAPHSHSDQLPFSGRLDGGAWRVRSGSPEAAVCKVKV